MRPTATAMGPTRRNRIQLRIPRKSAASRRRSGWSTAGATHGPCERIEPWAGDATGCSRPGLRLAAEPHSGLAGRAGPRLSPDRRSSRLAVRPGRVQLHARRLRRPSRPARAARRDRPAECGAGAAGPPRTPRRDHLRRRLPGQLRARAARARGTRSAGGVLPVDRLPRRAAGQVVVGRDRLDGRPGDGAGRSREPVARRARRPPQSRRRRRADGAVQAAARRGDDRLPRLPGRRHRRRTCAAGRGGRALDELGHGARAARAGHGDRRPHRRPSGPGAARR